MRTTVSAAITALSRGHWWKAIPFVAAAILVLAACFAGGAQAARVHSLLAEEALPSSEDFIQFGIGVNQETGHIYLPVGAGGVYNYDADGSLDSSLPLFTSALRGKLAIYLAVDNSSGATGGDIWVSENEPFVGNELRQILPSGVPSGVVVNGSSIPPAGTLQPGGLPPVVNDGSFRLAGIALNAEGDLFVVDWQAKAIDEFSPTGVFIAQIGAGRFDEHTGAIAVDSATDELFIARNIAAGPFPQGVIAIDPQTGECIESGCTPITTEFDRGLAVDESSGLLFGTSLLPSGVHIGQGKISEYDLATGQRLGETDPPSLHQPEVIAVDESTGHVITGDREPQFENTLKIFGPVEIVADVVSLAATGVADSEADLAGEVGAAGVADARCVFQYTTAEAFGAYGFDDAAEAPCEQDGEPAGPFSGTALNPVEAHLSGLRGGTEYDYRVLGVNGNGSNTGEVLSFTTDGPTVSATSAGNIEETSAILEGAVNPRGSATTYAFQLVTQATFEAHGFGGAPEIPLGGSSIGAGNAAVAVSQQVEGLVPGTAYRLRTVATGAGGSTPGTTDGPAVGFMTYAAPQGGLPDGRAYEQVTPVDKNGNSVEGEINAVQASPEGGAITFFAWGGIPGGEGAQYFPSYLATRDADESGWTTQGLLPPASIADAARIAGWSENLSNTYEFAARGSEPGQIVSRSNGDGSFTPVASLEGTVHPLGEPILALAGASSDGSVALLEEEGGGLSAGDLPGKKNVYAFDNRSHTLTVAGVLNDGTVPSEGVVAGSYNWFNTAKGPSQGGASNSYYTEAQHAISSGGDRVIFTAEGTNQLYMRVNPTAVQSPMQGGSCSDPALACTIRISEPNAGVSDPQTSAAFVGATANGEVVYFLDEGKLTSDATVGGYQLYRYDATAPAGSRLTDLSIDSTDSTGARVEGVLGIGAVGDDVYFVAGGKLSADATKAPTGETNLYVAHAGGSPELITRVGTGPSERVNWNPRSKSVGGEERSAHAARVSSDGQALLFSSSNPLTGYESKGFQELYLFQVGQGIRCVSCNPTGHAPTGGASVQAIPGPGTGTESTFAIMTRNLSADGRRVFFDSTDRLVAADQNDVNDVYEWEQPGEEEPGEPDSCTTGSSAYVPASGGCLFLISGGVAGGEPSWFADADERGRNAFFFTAQKLVTQDRDELVDIYDARIGGGIAAQAVEPAASCEDESSCVPAASLPPATSAPATLGAQGGGNLPPPKRCKKSQVRKHGKCVAKPKKKSAKHKAKRRKKQSRDQQSGKNHKRRKGGKR